MESKFALLCAILVLPPLHEPPAELSGSKEKAEASDKAQYVADVLKAQEAWREGDITRVRGLMDRYIPAPGSPDVRGPEWHKLHALYQKHQFELRCSGEKHDQVQSIKWSPNGKWLASVVRGSVQIWDMESGKERLSVKDAGVTNWSPDSRWLAVSGPQTVLMDMSKAKGTIVLEDSTGWQSAWSPDSRFLAVSGKSNSIHIWELHFPRKPLIKPPCSSEVRREFQYSPL